MVLHQVAAVASIGYIWPEGGAGGFFLQETNRKHLRGLHSPRWTGHVAVVLSSVLFHQNARECSDISETLWQIFGALFGSGQQTTCRQ